MSTRSIWRHSDGVTEFRGKQLDAVGPPRDVAMEAGVQEGLGRGVEVRGDLAWGAFGVGDMVDRCPHGLRPATCEGTGD